MEICGTRINTLAQTIVDNEIHCPIIIVPSKYSTWITADLRYLSSVDTVGDSQFGRVITMSYNTSGIPASCDIGVHYTIVYKAIAPWSSCHQSARVIASRRHSSRDSQIHDSTIIEVTESPFISCICREIDSHRFAISIKNTSKRCAFRCHRGNRSIGRSDIGA